MIDREILFPAFLNNREGSTMREALARGSYYIAQWKDPDSGAFSYADSWGPRSPEEISWYAWLAGRIPPCVDKVTYFRVLPGSRIGALILEYHSEFSRAGSSSSL
jgi:hypothetical protein